MKSLRREFQKLNCWPAIILIATGFTLVACSEKPAAPPVPKIEPAPLLQQERATLEKAKGVEQQVIKNSEELKQEIEQKNQE